LTSRAIVREVVVRRQNVLSGHARLPLRTAGGDYPVAIVSVSAAVDAKGLIQQASVAVGSVEPEARRWPELERWLVGLPLDPDRAAEAAERLTAHWTGRDDVDAPGWYRVRVLPALVSRAIGDVITTQGGRR
jgi:carbon-monoxide dehydrogenase medium subunit